MDKKMKEEIKNILIKGGVDCSNFDLAYKEFMKYFNLGGVIDEREEKILAKVKGHTDIRAVPKEVLELKDLIPSIRGRISNSIESMGVTFNDTYDAVIKELESSVLSTMINDIVRGTTHKPMFNDYRDAVSLKKYSRKQFKEKLILERRTEDDKTGLIKKSITNIICATDGHSLLPEAKDFLINVEKFCKVCRVNFMNINNSTVTQEDGTIIQQIQYKEPVVYNDKPLLLLTRRTEYYINENGYTPEKQKFNLIICTC